MQSDQHTGMVAAYPLKEVNDQVACGCLPMQLHPHRFQPDVYSEAEDMDAAARLMDRRRTESEERFSLMNRTLQGLRIIFEKNRPTAESSRKERSG